MSAAVTRRDVYYTSLDDLLADVERLAQTKSHTTGQWTFPQILDHLARSFNASLDGFGFRAPWIARVLLAPLLRNSFFTKTMKPGFKLPAGAEALAPDANLSLTEAVQKLTESVTRFRSTPQRAPHPFLGELAPREYDLLHMRHAELHMSYVIPDETP
ncbi:MAG: DUF1569 domain-containing protein [Planctomycetes bacterium]|nr:DUF1569 domain-containing protein [Planctomycetota bacterium]